MGRLTLKNIRASEFVKNVFTIFTGNVVAQAIPFLMEPVLARIYSPDDFAVVSVYLAVANLFSIVATGRYELAIMLPKEDKKSIKGLNLFHTCECDKQYLRF